MTKEDFDLMFPDDEMQHQMILEALADVEAGRVVSHESMLEWLNSLGSDNPLPMPTS